MRGLITIGLLIISNSFMTLAWYGHLKWFKKWGIVSVILVSWGLAFFEYCFQVPANRTGFKALGGPFSLVQLKIIQETITLSVFTLFSVIVFHNKIGLNQFIGFCLLVGAVFFIFK